MIVRERRAEGVLAELARQDEPQLQAIDQTKVKGNDATLLLICYHTEDLELRNCLHMLRSDHRSLSGRWVRVRGLYQTPIQLLCLFCDGACNEL